MMGGGRGAREMFPRFSPSTVSLKNVDMVCEGGGVETRRVGESFFAPPAPPFYEGGGRVWVGQGNVFSTAEPRNPASCPRGEAVALGRRHRGRLRGRPRPQPRPGGEGIPHPATAVAVRLPARRRPAAAAIAAVASL